MKAAGEKIRTGEDGVVAFDLDVAAQIVAKLKMADEFHLLHDAEVLAHELELNGDDLERAEETMILEYGLDHDRFIAAGMLLAQTQSEMKRQQKNQQKKAHRDIDGDTVGPAILMDDEPEAQPEPEIIATVGKRDESAYDRKKRLRREQQERDIANAALKLAERDLHGGQISGLNWRAAAKCGGDDPELFFPINSPIQEQMAKEVCATCTVSTQCLTEALDTGSDHGIWGGLNERQRRALLRRRAGRRL